MDTATKIGIRNWAIGMAPKIAEKIEALRLTGYFEKIREKGYTLPLPGLIKRSIIQAEAKRIGADIFVETGTYLGDSIWHFRNSFERLFSIEVNPVLAGAAQRRFRKRTHIAILQGDSSVVLGELMPKLDGRTLFFLDGHYSGGITGKGDLECPIWKEMACILASGHQNYSILIDDARLFGRDRDYPALTELLPFLAKALPQHTIKVENDLIFVQMPVAG